MNISSTTVKELRDRTNAGFMDCKRALEESKGDIETAVDIIRKKGLAVAAKRAGRAANEGRVSYAHTKKLPDGSQAVALFELNSETDFVARSDLFKSAVGTITQCIDTHLSNGKLPANPDLRVETVLELLVDKNNAPQPDMAEKSIGEMVQMLTGTLGERIELSRIKILTAPADALISTYIHAGDKIISTVIVATDNTSEEVQKLVRDLALHVAASRPLYLKSKDVSQQDLDKEKEIYLDQAIASGKPREIAEKIVMGKMKSYYSEVCLMDQPFVKDPKMAVVGYVSQLAASLGATIEVTGFARLSCGEK